LTATPKRTDNVDTYAYFGRPVYEYPMAKGIEDGFLAPPEEIITLSLSTDKKGKLVIKELRSKGIRIEVPKGAKLKEEYTAYLDAISERARQLVNLYEEREKELEKLWFSSLDEAFKGKFN